MAADPNQQKTFCALLTIDDEKSDPNFKAAIDGYVKQRGSEFQKAWDVVESIDENSPGDQAVGAMLDELDGKCR